MWGVCVCVLCAKVVVVVFSFLFFFFFFVCVCVCVWDGGCSASLICCDEFFYRNEKWVF